MEELKCTGCDSDELEVIAIGTAKAIFKCHHCASYTIVDLNKE